MGNVKYMQEKHKPVCKTWGSLKLRMNQVSQNYFITLLKAYKICYAFVNLGVFQECITL